MRLCMKRPLGKRDHSGARFDLCTMYGGARLCHVVCRYIARYLMLAYVLVQ